LESDDAWVRDTGPTFVWRSDGTNKSLVGINWEFNAWGGILPSYENDKHVNEYVTKAAGADRLAVEKGFVLEGGSFHTDGEGTILTTEECLLNPNRNPHLTKDQIEIRLLSYLGGKKVIWLPLGLAADEDTNGHIDNICCFSKPGEVLLAWTDDTTDEQYERSRKALEVLEREYDA